MTLMSIGCLLVMIRYEQKDRWTDRFKAYIPTSKSFGCGKKIQYNSPEFDVV